MSNIKMMLTKTRQYEKLNKMTGPEWKRICAKVLTSPIIVWQMISDSVKTEQKEKKGNFQYQFSVSAIVKNEGPYILEWIEYHKLMGVDKFYIYDNESTDDIETILSSYIKSGEVTYRYYPGKLRQLEAYKDAVQNYRFESKYMAFFDIDEFLMPVDGKTCALNVIEDLFNKHKNVGAVAVNWLHYGSANHKQKPEGFVIENYLYRAEDSFDRNRLVKTICNPRRVVFFVNPHHPILDDKYDIINENGTIVTSQFCDENSCQLLCLNHYFCKSREEALIKMQRGKISDNKKLDWSTFEDRDRNEVYDPKMLEFSEKLRKMMYEV